MKKKNLALMMVLSAGFLIHGISTAHADENVFLKEIDLSKENGFWEGIDFSNAEHYTGTIDENGEWNFTKVPKETEVKLAKYTDDDYRDISEVRDVIDERDALVEKFRNLKKKFTEVEKDATALPTDEEKKEAQAQWDKGSLGFYDKMGSSEAVEVFKSLPSRNGVGYKASTGPKYLEINKITNKIDEHDSRSLENMKKGIESIRDVNAKRHKDGGIDGIKLSVIGISDFDMAVAQANANYSKDIIEHSSVYGPPYENLAWTNGDINAPEAIERWWDKEKVVFDFLREKGLSSRKQMEEYIANNEGDIKNKFWSPQVGHYLNLVDDLGWGANFWRHEDTISSGYGINTNGSIYPITKSLVMNPESPINRTVYSIDDYEKRFLTYYTDLKSIIKDNKKIVDKSALEEIASLKSEMTGLKGQIDSCEQNLKNLKKKNVVYLELRDTIKDNRATVDAVQYLLENSPKKIAHARAKILKLLDESKVICEQAEALLKKAGITFDF
ncbi:hypothetical protein [uncultured Anaerococcus sp.]|uniref:hypothetical protein n=1 Tax=uncultured Anaerococcus sp. TaxID=293428 RepID=UPI00288C5C8E|nr:hypothetical protein [uncultured Anaerococcus sp.]